MDYSIKEKIVEHFFHNEEYDETYFWICVDSAKKELESENLRVEVSFVDSNVSKLAIVKGHRK